MAEEKKDDIELVESGKGGKKKLMIIIIALLLVIIAGLAAYLLLGGKADKDEAKAADAKTAQKDVKKTPIYYSVDTPFIVNFSQQSKGTVSYLQVKMKVMSRNQAVIDAFKLNLPAVQDALLKLFYSQKYDDLTTSEGVKKLQQATLNKINEILHAQEKLEGNMEAVYFTSFIMQ